MRWFWWVAWHVVNLLLWFLFGFRVYGRENIPREGGVLLAANHRANLDPPIVGAAATREVHFIAKDGLFRVSRFFTWLITTFNTFPLRREGGDHQAIKTVTRLLRQGKAIVIFPEGTRSKTGVMLPAKMGVGYLALTTGCPVVPTGIAGTNRKTSDLLFGRARIEVRFGPAIRDFNHYPTEKEGYRRLSEEVIQKIAELEAGNR
jgi:1-acyl-sn-glycerol-3-phosphate acyltransferase